MFPREDYARRQPASDQGAPASAGAQPADMVLGPLDERVRPA